MSPVVTTLYKTIVVRFYERNVGFFLFIFLVMFGVVESSQIVSYHFSLIGAMLDSGLFMGVVFAVWLAYALKCVQFIHEALGDPRNSFLQLLRGIRLQSQFKYFSLIIFFLFIPVSLYVIFILGIAMATGHWSEVTIIIVYLIALITGSARMAMVKLNYFSKGIFSKSIPSINILINTSLFVFYFSHLFRNRSIPVLLTKLFSLLTIVGFFNIQVDHYEVRIPLLGFLIGLSAHAVIVFEIRRFEDNFLMFMRNMPLSILTRYLHLLIVYSLLLTPELVMIGINHIKIFDCLLIWFFGSSILLVTQMSLYPMDMNMDKYIVRLLFFFPIAFMGILFKMYIIMMILLFVISFWMYRIWYYQFDRPLT